jgi:hypothetical protein
MTPHWRSLFVSIIVKRRLQMITEFDNYIHLNQASIAFCLHEAVKLEKGTPGKISVKPAVGSASV